MARARKLKNEIENNINVIANENIENLEIPKAQKVSGKIKITSLKSNFKFSIFWLEYAKTREFDIEIFNKHKELCKDFDLEIKKGNLKIEY
jgi:hypothetical protein